MNVIVRVTVVVIVVVMRVTVCLCGFLKPELGRRHTGPEHTLGRDGFHVQRQTAERAPQLVSGSPRSSRAPSTMSPDAPEKQSKYAVFATSKPSLLAKTEIAPVSQNNVVEHVDPHQHSSGDQPLGQPRSSSARLWIAGRMIVEQHDGRRAPAAASRKISRGCTMLASSVPTERIDVRSTGASCRAERSRTARPAGCRTAAAEYSATERGLVTCTRSRPPRVTMRRPSSTAASTCAARAAPMPGSCPQIPVTCAAERFDAADRREQRVREIERAGSRLTLSNHDGHELVVAQRSSAEPLRASRAADRAARRLSSYTIPVILPAHAARPPSHVALWRACVSSARSPSAWRARSRRRRKSIAHRVPSMPPAPPAPISTRPKRSTPQPPPCSRPTRRYSSAITVWHSPAPWMPTNARSKRRRKAPTAKCARAPKPKAC